MKEMRNEGAISISAHIERLGSLYRPFLSFLPEIFEKTETCGDREMVKIMGRGLFLPQLRDREKSWQALRLSSANNV